MKSNPVTVHGSGEFHWVGDGFPVKSVFGYSDLGKELSPFLLLDYAAPHEFAPGNQPRGVGGHPHRGFETVTLAYQGEIQHRDSSGGGGIIGPGDVQWMTAASGLVHDEFHSESFTKSGGTFEMVQLWVNLPAEFKSADPGYQTILDGAIPRVEVARGVTARVVAGELNGTKGPAKTFTPINLWDVEFTARSSAVLPLPQGHTKALLVLRGSVSFGEVAAGEGQLVTTNRTDSQLEVAATNGAKILVLTGEPINEPIVGYGPFVMNTQAEIKQAFVDFQMGRMGVLE